MSIYDEHEARLREDIFFTALNFDDQNYYAKWKAEMDIVIDALLDYVRLRAVGGYGCRSEYHDGSLLTDKPCPVCEAQRRLDALTGGGE